MSSFRAEVLALDRGKRLELRQHVVLLADAHRRVRTYRRFGLDGVRRPEVQARARGSSVPGPSDEVVHFTAARVEDDDVVVVAQLLDRGQPGLRAVPRVLVVEDHGPPVQSFELGNVLGAVEDLLVAVDWVVRIVGLQGVREAVGLVEDLGDGGLDGRQLRGVEPPVTQHVEEDLEDPVLDFVVPRRGKSGVLLLDRRDLALGVFPRRQNGKEHVVAVAWYVAPAGRALLVHGHREAVRPEHVQRDVTHELVPGGVPVAGLDPPQEVRAAWGLGLEIAADDRLELVEILDDGEVELGQEVGREDHAAMTVDDERLHCSLRSVSRAVMAVVSAWARGARGYGAKARSKRWACSTSWTFDEPGAGAAIRRREIRLSPASRSGSFSGSSSPK